MIYDPPPPPLPTVAEIMRQMKTRERVRKHVANYRQRKKSGKLVLRVTVDDSRMSRILLAAGIVKDRNLTREQFEVGLQRLLDGMMW